MSLFQLANVSKRFGKHVVLEGVDLTVDEGEILGIVGINGSGKTTLLKLLIGYYRPDKGTIAYRGKPMKKVLKKMQQEIGFAVQENSFYPKLTVEENIAYFGSLYGLNAQHAREHMERALVFLDLTTVRNQLAGQLSGGMQRRLEMACSLIHDPKVLILDEPTEDLDPLLRRDILGLIRRINNLGTTVIITSHLLGDVEALCNRIAILHNKRIVRAGKVEELRALYRQKDEIHLQTEGGHYDLIIRELRLKEFYVEGARLVVYTNDAQRLVGDILRILENEGDRLMYLDVRRPSLQEVFEEITDKRWL